MNSSKLFSSQEFLQHAYPLVSSNEFEVNSGTFDESLSAGSLKYIQNDRLRNKIFEYHRKAKLNTIDKYATQQKYDVIFPLMCKTLSTSNEFFEDFIGNTTNFISLDMEALPLI